MIAYACSDLMFATRIRATAESMGLPTHRWAAGEIMEGRLPEATKLVLIDLDMGPSAVEAIHALQRHREGPDEASPTPNIIAFGSHVEAERLRAARTAGADQALPRSVFVQTLKSILSAFAEPPAESQGDSDA